MKCKYCNNDIDDNATFCSYCGNKVDPSKKEEIYCVTCGNKFTDEAMFCPVCGTSKRLSVSRSEPLETKQTTFVTNAQREATNTVPKYHTNNQRGRMNTPPVYRSISTVKKQSFYKNPILWIISIALLSLSLVLGLYIQEQNTYKRLEPSRRTQGETKEREDIPDEKGNSDITNFSITEEMGIYTQQDNMNMGGYVYYYDGLMYVATENGVITYNNQFEEEETILYEDVSCLYVDDTYLYYTDVDSTYYRYNKTTKEEEMLFEEAYYPQKVDTIVYYQNYTDNGTLYSYDLDTKESIKLNDIVSYQIYVDKERNSIYYLAYDKDTYNDNIYRMDLDGQNNAILISESAMSFTYDGTTISYLIDGTLYGYDVATNEQIEVVYNDNAYYGEVFNMNNNIGCLGDTGVYIIDANKEVEALIDGSDDVVYSVQVVGENLVCWIDDGDTCGVYVLDIDGNYTYLIEGYTFGDYYSDDYDYEEDDGDDEMFDL
jgi:hypothetical protein